jgi:two-component sensor histidine kinase
MPAYLLWVGGAGLGLALLTWLAVRAWDRRVAAELDVERRAQAELQAELQAERDAIDAERRNAEAQRLMLLHEVNHRARNALTVAQSLVRLTHGGERGRGADVTARIAALAGAHDLLAENDWEGAELRQIAARTLAAFAGPSVVLAGGGMAVAAAAVQPLSMILHELATNAAKHGALSVPAGRVEVDWRLEPLDATAGTAGDTLVLDWAEHGGPPVAGPPARRGFGSRLIERGLPVQLGRGSTVRMDFAPEGLRCRIRAPLRPGAVAAATR